MSEIPKAYEPQSVEGKWYAFWEEEGCFTANADSPKPAYSIVIPPPNVTGMLHMGHVLNNTIQDILARKARMDGMEVLWLPGTDHAGIATQVQVEKALKKEERLTKHDLGREKFLERVWQWKEKHGGIIIQQLKKLGCSCDWTRERFTMDPEYSRSVQSVFVKLYKKGLIYRGKRMVNWDPAARTALSDEEVEMTETKGHLWHLKYPMLDAAGQPVPDQFVIVATTRPETMLGDEAVAVNPKDERYTKLVGHKVLLPLQNKHIPIIADDFVDPKFGTGCVKVTPAHDPNDYAMATRHNLPLTVVIGPDGKMTGEAGGGFAGLDRAEARKAVVEHLEKLGLLLKVEDYVHNVGCSQRSNVPIEPYLSEQWFLKYPSVEKATECVTGSTGYQPVPPGDAPGGTGMALEQSNAALNIEPHSISVGGAPTGTGGSPVPPDPGLRFHPDRWAKTYAHWMTNLRDWCISRQLWWGHRIPVWYNSEACGKASRGIPIIELSGNELGGATIKQLRDAAWEFADKHAFLNHSFPNAETGWNIVVRPASLEHAFTRQGPANIKAVVALPELIRTAIKIGSLHHLPPNEHFKAVHLFVAAARIGGELFQVKITVKEHLDGQKLYDHQLFKKSTPDGESPTPAALASKPTRPTSGAGVLIADLFQNVNTDTAFTRCQIEEPGQGWQQDPDVLDTWFSSWLWPFATMGWTGDKAQDSINPALHKFYPTTDLVTGPDIIFFWVARMIMAGYEFMGDLPFRNVYFTGIIRDKLGRKMSKSLGNSPDPFALIAKYGADALRFGTMRSAPLGQDVLFDEKDVELGRNFCNKLWNACRFRQMVGSGDASSPKGQVCDGGVAATFEVQGEINPALLTSDDKWILLKLDQAIREITTAFAEYKFSDATATLYRFFWSEYCDWYVEASKAVLGNAERGTRNAEQEVRRANTVAVIDFVLSHTLRLFHPFLPFITEELWHGMGYAEDMPEDQGGKTIMFARWPKPLDQDFRERYGLTDEQFAFVNAKYDLVSQGRNLRCAGNIPGNKKVRYVLKPSGDLLPHDAEVIKLLLNAQTLEVNAAFQPGKGTPTCRTVLGDLFLPLEGLIDVAAETARLTKELEKIEAEIAKVELKLNNPGFTQKAPPKVLEEHKQRLAEWQSKRDHAKSALEMLKG